MSGSAAGAGVGVAARRYQRAPRRGERRRGELLRALRDLLESRPLANISIGDITRAAGATRSAFYFYFPTKAAAVAALLEDMYEALLEASGRWHGVESGRGNDELREGFDAVVGYARAYPRLLVAVFDAVGSDAEVREMWAHWMRELAVRVGDKVARERAAGRAPDGADPGAVGTVLVAMNERALEQEVRAIVGGAAPSDAMTDALYEIWQRAIYGGDHDGNG